MSDIYESITLDLDKITDERIRRIVAATDELMDEKLASIGYVKVVRCGDCKHHKTGDAGSYCCKSITTLYNPDGFCAWGERRDV